MYRTDALKRYTSALNEVIEAATVGPGVIQLNSYAKKYGMSPGFFTFFVKQGLIIKNGSGKKVTYTLSKSLLDKRPVTDVQMTVWMNEYNRFKYDLKENGGTKEAPVRYLPGAKMAELTTSELFKELKRRGYTGTLEIKKRIKL
jgi:hypothetical protein